MHRDRRERIVLEVEHKGFFHKIAQTVFAKPEKFYKEHRNIY